MKALKNINKAKLNLAGSLCTIPYALCTIALIALLSLSSCRDEGIYNPETGEYEGPVNLTLDFSFEPLYISTVETRGLPGNLDFELNDITIFLYDGNAEDTASPVYSESFTKEKFQDTLNKGENRYQEDQENQKHCEEQTWHGSVTTSQQIKSGSYRIYVVANVSDDILPEEVTWATITEQQLRELQIAWPAASTVNADGTTPTECGVPNAMFGYCKSPSSHPQKAYQDVIYHQNTELYEGSTDENDMGKNTDNRPAAINLNSEDVTLQAWLKRPVSKLNIGFDGTALNPGVEIYIKSVCIKNAASTCYLGQDNSVGGNVGNEVKLAEISDYTKDSRLYLEYSSEDEDESIALTRGQVFPRQANTDVTTDEGKQEWKDFVFGSSSNINPVFSKDDKDIPTTLYFFENLQGVKTPVKDENGNDINYKTQKQESSEIPNGTYVEVKAYYKNDFPGKESNGEITYRFMLGKNVTNDYNVERNHHYKLTLSFIGDALNTDWNIDYNEEEITEYYFRIPYDVVDGGYEQGKTDTWENDEGENYTEKWDPEENWNRSWVWYAYDNEGNPVAEIAKELVYDGGFENNGYPVASGDLATYYQVVTVYPIVKEKTTYLKDDYGTVEDLVLKPGMTNLREGKIIQVLKSEESTETDLHTKEGGAGFSLWYRFETHWNLSSNNDGYSTEKLRAQARLHPVIKQELIPAIIQGGEGCHGNYLYVKYNPEDHSLTPIDEPLDEKYRLRTRPYIVKDYDGHHYPIVKVGSSYWFRENMRTKYKYVNKSGDYTPLDEWNSELEEQNKFIDENPTTPNMEQELGVYIPVAKAMYKYRDNDKDGRKYGLLYNFATVVGTANKNNVKAELNGYPLKTQYGNGFPDRIGVGHFYQIGETWQREKQEGNEWKITPDGWHIPSSRVCDPNYWADIDTEKEEEVLFGEFMDDIVYLNGYMDYDLTMACVDKDTYQWPKELAFSNRVYPYVHDSPNLSGLSLLALPCKYDGNGIELTTNYYRVKEGEELKYENYPYSQYGRIWPDLNKLVEPFWTPQLVYGGTHLYSSYYVGTLLYTTEESDYTDKHSVGYISWPGFMTGSVTDLTNPNPWFYIEYNFDARTEYAPYKELHEEYLPVRPCRNSYKECYEAPDFDTLNAIWSPSTGK